MKISSQKGFTLIELLVVMGILAVLAAVTVLILNPVQFLAQSRDSVRISDLDTLNRAINLASLNISNLDLDGPSYSNSCLGQSAQKIFVSVPSGVGTAPTPPSGWTIQQVSVANLAETNGSGWLPVDLSNGQLNPPVNKLPVDPVNTFDSGYYYSYVCGSYELNAAMESTKYQTERAANDGGDDPLVYETGSVLAETPVFRGNSVAVADKYVCRDYNACPNDGVDDTAALNNAFAAGETYSTIAFEAGIYNISASGPSAGMVFVNKPNITITGTGATLSATTSGSDAFIINVSNVTLNGLKIDGNHKVTNGILTNGISTTSSVTNITLNNLEISGLNQTSGAYDSGHSTYYADPSVGCVTAEATGIFVRRGSDHVTVENSYIHDIDGNVSNGANGIWITGYGVSNPATYTDIRDNRFDDIRNSAGANVCNGWDANGIHVFGGTSQMYATIENNLFTNIAKRAIKIQAYNVTADHNTIQNTSTDWNSKMYSGISVYGSHIILLNNTITGGFFNYGAIEIGAGTMTDIQVSGNQISTSLANVVNPSNGSTYYNFGIYNKYTLSNVTIDSNAISGFATGIYPDALTLNMSDSSITHNTIQNISSVFHAGSSGYGIIITKGAGAFSNISVANNSFTNGGKYLIDAETDGTNLTSCKNTGTYNAGGATYSDGTLSPTRVVVTNNC